MKQEYLNHLFENYTDVEKFYWTADGTAFKSPEEAKAYAKILGNPAIKMVDHGGLLKDALDYEPGEGVAQNDIAYEQLNIGELKERLAARDIPLKGATKKVDLIALLVAADNAAAGDPGPINYNTMDIAQLIALCNERDIEVDEGDDEAALIARLLAWDENQD